VGHSSPKAALMYLHGGNERQVVADAIDDD